MKTLLLALALAGPLVFPTTPALPPPAGPPGSTSVAATTRAVTLYVDPQGSDSNLCAGTGTAACLTIQRAVSVAPKGLNDGVTISVAALPDGGTAAYAYPSAWAASGALVLAGFTADEGASTQASRPSWLHIEGTFREALAQRTMSGGVSSGNVTAVATFSGAAVTAHAYQGMLVEVTGGTGWVNPATVANGAANPNLYPVTDNSTTTITVLYGFFVSGSLDATTTFRVLDPATVLYPGLTGTPTTPVAYSTLSAFGNGVSQHNPVEGIAVRYMKIVGGASVAPLAVVEGTYLVFDGCVLDDSAGLLNNGLWVKRGGQVDLIDSVLIGGTGNAAYIEDGSVLKINDTYVKGSVAANSLSRVSVYYSQLDKRLFINAGSFATAQFSNMNGGANSGVHCAANSAVFVTNCETSSTPTRFGVEARSGCQAQVTGSALVGTLGNVSMDGSTATTYVALDALTPKRITSTGAQGEGSSVYR